jgi:CRP-like cAMP-binding protein
MAGEHDVMLATLRSRVDVPDDEYNLYREWCELKRYRKAEHVLREGDIPRFNIFISKGCMRTYYTGADGKERTTHFAEEGYWTGDLESMRNNVPTRQNVQALEDCEVITLSREKWELAYKQFAWIAAIHAMGQQRRAAKLAEHIGRLLSDDPEENYRLLLHERPSLVQRVPQYYIASYLGITPETLSRLRKKMASR